MNEQQTETWRLAFMEYLQKHWETNDGAHDMHHLHRVWNNSKTLYEEEGKNADKLVLLAACYFHDYVSLPKNHPERAQSSFLSAEKTAEILAQHFPGFPAGKIPAVQHAIHAHSFSANIATQSIEAAILQDADRMEALGAIGIARLFYTAGKMDTALFDPEDPLALNRTPNDKEFALDHIAIKLLQLPLTMKTDAGKRMADEKARYIRNFRNELVNELGTR